MTDHAQREDTKNHEESAAGEREKIRRRIAERLTRARKNTGLTIHDAAGSLKLAPDYLRAFESGEWKGLPEEVYTLGFLRQYARFIGLDLEDDIKQLKSPDYRLSRPVTTPEPPTSPTRKWAIVSAILFVALFALFNLLGDGDESRHTTPPESRQMQRSDAAKVSAPADLPTTAGKTAEKATEPESQASTAERHHYVFTASGKPVWLQVFSSSHELLREALLRAGERLRINDASRELLITCGNAAALQISVDGSVVHPAGSLGGDAEVLRDFRLTVPHPVPHPQ